MTAATNILQAEARAKLGKGSARTLRRDGKIPAVIYGKSQQPVHVAVSLHDFTKEYKKPGFTRRVYDIKVGKESYHVIPREVHLHPVSDIPEHADFLKIDDSTRVRVNIKVNFLNREKSPGLKRGGVLNIVRREIEVFCMPRQIPESLDVNLEGLDIGDSVHISHIKLPEGVTPTITDRDFTVAALVGRSKEPSEEEAAAAAAAAASVEGGAAAPAATGGAAAPAKGAAPAAAPAKGGDAKKK